MKVYQAINAVQGELSKVGITKDRKNQQQGYNFRGIDDCYNVIAPLLAKHGLCILPFAVNRTCREVTNKNGTLLFYTTIECEFHFVSAEDGSKHIVKTFGEAMDSGDKSSNKAQSAAYKYAVMQAFSIPTEGDNDADSTTHEVVKELTESQMDSVVSQMYDAVSIDALQAAFGRLWHSASKKQQAQLKTTYDQIKNSIEGNKE